MAERKTTTRLSNVKVKFGYYRNGKLLYSKANPEHFEPEGGYKPGDVIVREGVWNSYGIYEYKGPNYKSNVPAFADGGFHLTSLSKRKVNDPKLIPKALQGHVTATQETGYYHKSGHGGHKKTWVGTDSSKTVTVTFGSGGFRTSKEAVTPDLEKELDRAWTVRNKPPKLSSFDTREAFDLAESRYKDWIEAKKKHGTTFNKLDANNKLDDKEQNYAYVVNLEGWTPGNLLQEIPLRKERGGKLHDIKDIIERNPWLIKPKEWQEVHGKPPPKNVFQNQTQSPSTTSSNAQSSTSGLGIPKNNTLIASASGVRNNLDYGDGTDNTNVSSYEQDATTSWGRGSYNTKGTTKDLKSRNQRTMAYWGGNQEQGGKGYDFSGYRGDDRDLARALRTGEAWETGKGTIIYQPDRGPMQVFKQSPTKPVIEQSPPGEIASTNKGKTYG